jgi:hypothetical protein
MGSVAFATSGTSGSYEQVHGPPAAQPAQQKGNPTWMTGLLGVGASQVAHVNGGVVLRDRMPQTLRGHLGQAAGRHVNAT